MSNILHTKAYYIMYTANSRLTHEKALCEWFRNLSKRNVVRATAAIVELNSDWLNPVRVSDDSLNLFY